MTEFAACVESTMKTYLIVGLAAFASLAACCATSYGRTGFITSGNGLKKASFDMQCAESQLEVIEISGDSVGVRGCDKQARYQLVGGAGWVLDSGARIEKK